MTAYEGSQLNSRTFEEILPEEWPFAHNLRNALEKLGVAIQAYKPIENEEALAAGFLQFHITKPRPEELAVLIKEKCGDSVQFGEMFVPLGLYFSGYEKAGGVWVRRIIDYSVYNDGVVQRWDVIVRPK